MALTAGNGIVADIDVSPAMVRSILALSICADYFILPVGANVVADRNPGSFNILDPTVTNFPS